jgi:hypothetical protein
MAGQISKNDSCVDHKSTNLNTSSLDHTNVFRQLIIQRVDPPVPAQHYCGISTLAVNLGFLID